MTRTRSISRRLRVSLTQSALVLVSGVVLSAQSPAAGQLELDYLYFKERVQPIFAGASAGQERCVTCHTSEAPLLEKLSPGATTWTNDQSRRHFEVWKELVVPGQPMDSPLLTQPLAPGAGGSGGHVARPRETMHGSHGGKPCCGACPSRNPGAASSRLPRSRASSRPRSCSLGGQGRAPARRLAATY